MPFRARRLPADMAGIATLRHDGRAGFARQRQNGRDLIDAAGLQQQRRRPLVKPAGFHEVRRDFGRIGNGMPLSDDGCETGKKLWYLLWLRE